MCGGGAGDLPLISLRVIGHIGSRRGAAELVTARPLPGFPAEVSSSLAWDLMGSLHGDPEMAPGPPTRPLLSRRRAELLTVA